MARLNLDVKMKPILTGIYGATLHECLQHLWWTRASALGPANINIFQSRQIPTYSRSLDPIGKEWIELTVYTEMHRHHS